MLCLSARCDGLFGTVNRSAGTKVPLCHRIMLALLVTESTNPTVHGKLHFASAEKSHGPRLAVVLPRADRIPSVP